MPKAPKAPGRPRDPATDRAIYDATLTLLGEVGLHAVTIEAIAARAGVSRPTIYRRWPSRDAILIDALIATVRPLQDPASGDIRSDLWRMLRDLMRDLDEHVGLTVLSVHASLREGSQLLGPLRERYLAPRARVIAGALRRGVAAGQLRDDLDLEIMRDLLFGPAIYHLLITGKPLSKRALEATFEATWRTLGAT